MSRDQTGAVSLRPWDAPELTGGNRVPMHAVPHPDRLVLDGTWDFQLLPHPHAEPGDTWRTIEVPGLWTMQGVADRPHYTNIPHVRINTPGVTGPAQQLVGFQRVDLAPGESRRVTFTVSAAQLGHTNTSRDFAVEPGTVDFFAGFDSDDHRVTGSFRPTGQTRILTGAERAFLSATTVRPL